MMLQRFFAERVARRDPLVLVTVFDTRGSTYSTAGGQMIIDSSGDFCGMLSGGCLEGDLVERARQVIETGTAQTAVYDLSADDELWGLGVGCDGRMHVLLQPLTHDNGYEPFAAMAEILEGGESAIAATIVEADGLSPGASVLLRKGSFEAFGIDDPSARAIAGAMDAAALADVQTPAGHCRVLYVRLTPLPALLVLGAGLDSEPLVRLATELGWRCTAVDHRPAYVEARRYPEATRTLCCNAADLGGTVDLAAFDMAIVMSHHLSSDRAYLEQLADSDIGYVGLLGPVGRRDRLMADLGDPAARFEGRLHGPAGIRLGGRGPAAIALEIVAGMQQFLAERVEVRGSIDVD